MSEQKSDRGISYYIPLALIAAFLIGCLSVALINGRGRFDHLTAADVSASDAAGTESRVRKSPVYENAGLKYRMVSASDLGLDDKAEQTSANPAVPKNKKNADANVSDSDAGLKLPLDKYVNFTPHRKEYTAYLTFDDGPSENTDAILDILDFYGVKATFFVNYHENMENQYKAIVNQGHTIALHTYTHNYRSVYTSEDGFFTEIEQISDYVCSLTGVRSMIIRFPGGSSNTISRKYNRGIMEVLKKSVPERGYVYQDWNVDSCDAEKANTPPKKLLLNIRTSLGDQKNAVVLMHDAGKNTRTTVEALPSIIEFFFSKGYAIEKMEMNTEEVHHNW